MSSGVIQHCAKNQNNLISCCHIEVALINAARSAASLFFSMTVCVAHANVVMRLIIVMFVIRSRSRWASLDPGRSGSLWNASAGEQAS